MSDVDHKALIRQAFTAQGYRAATVEGIAAAAGFTKGAFYRHFSSKAAAYGAVLEHAAGDAWRMGVKRVAAAESVLGTLRPLDVETITSIATGARPAQGATFRKRLERALSRFRLAWRARHGSD